MFFAALPLSALSHKVSQCHKLNASLSFKKETLKQRQQQQQQQSCCGAKEIVWLPQPLLLPLPLPLPQPLLILLLLPLLLRLPLLLLFLAFAAVAMLIKYYVPVKEQFTAEQS